MVKTKDYYSLILIVWCMKLKLMLLKTLAKIKCLILVIIQVNLHSFAIKLFTFKNQYLKNENTDLELTVTKRFCNIAVMAWIH